MESTEVESAPPSVERRILQSLLLFCGLMEGKYALICAMDIPKIAHFTVTVGNEAGVDLVLIQPCLLYYVNHVFVILNSIF